MSSEKNNYEPPYFLIKANDIEFRTYTQSGVDNSIHVLNRFKIDFTVDYIKE